MELVKLPELELPVSRMGLGGCPLGGHGWGQVEDSESIAAVREAYEQGGNFFDTADVYGFGHSEQLLAEALGTARHRVIIASKFGVRRLEGNRITKDASPAYLRSALQQSLRRLRIERLPLYYLHWPDGKTPIEETMQELARCRTEGLIGGIGLSNVSADELERACQITLISAVQVQYSLVDRAPVNQLLPVCQKYSIPLVTWGSLAQGLLTGKFNAQSQFAANDRRSRYENFQGTKFQTNLQMVALLQRLSAETGRTPGQIAIRWLLQTPGVGSVLFGAKRPTQVSENLGAMGWTLTPEQMQLLTNWTPHQDSSGMQAA
ncbi:aldo/keto reductase [Planctomicrobium sp. SH664]|uniref:aldo/keto reductase n=1 Tax=Planctomicrobium sp. SH664 TaxID=3448125 RepID=UPI003F5C47E6